MDEKRTPPDGPGKVSARTSDRVARMSDEARAELARNIAERRAAGGDVPERKATVSPLKPARRGATVPEPEADAAAVRIAADLQRTERRIQQIERSFSSSRYQMAEGGPPSGRYARLLRRANRLERQLRTLR
jgi:hypothetical protein